MSDFSPNVRPVPALRARVWVAQGAWVKRSAGCVSEDCPLRTTSAICASSSTSPSPGCSWPGTRPSVAADVHRRGDPTPGAPPASGGRGERTGSVIEILVLQALAHQTRGDIPAALASLQRALTLAEPEGYVRLFVDEGPPMASLLRAAAKQGIAPSYVRRLLAAIDTTAGPSAGQAGLIEPLSERELDVLRLLGTDLDGPDIARELVVSLNTVRTHTKNIYAKLGVNNRRAAVRRARELDLLSRYARDAAPPSAIPSCTKRTCTCVPDAIHTLQRVHVPGTNVHVRFCRRRRSHKAPTNHHMNHHMW